MITVNTPDGGTGQFPDGTPPEAIKKAMAAKFGGPQPAPQPAPGSALSALQLQGLQQAKAGTLQVSPEAVAKAQAGEHQFGLSITPDQGTGLSALQGFDQGGTFGFSDEILAGMDHFLGGQNYDASLRNRRLQLDKAREQHPIAAYGGELAGGIVSSAPLGGGYIAGAKTLPQLIARSALVGGGQGAFYGSGTGEGGVVNRLKSAAIGGGIGAAAGAALPIIGKGIQLGARAVMNPIKATLNIADNAAASRGVAKALSRSGMSASEVQAALDAAGKEGQSAFTLADALGPSGQSMLSGATRTPGSAKQEVIDSLTQRQGGQARRIGGFISDALGAPDTAAARTASLTAARKAAADTAYEAARQGAGPVDIRGALSVIDNRIGGMSGSGVASDGIDGILSGFRSRLAADSPKSPNLSVELSDFSRVLGVKQEVEDAIGQAVRSGRGNAARELGKLKDALDSALEGASAGYRKANDGFASASRVIDAVGQGSAATSIRSRAADTAKTYGAMVPEQQAAFRAGYADPTLARVENAAIGANKARPILNDGTMADMSMMARDPALLQRQLGREDTMFRTASRAMGGSNTTEDLHNVADVQGLDIPFLLNLIRSPKTAAVQLAGKAASAVNGRGEATRALLAKALLSQDVNAALAPAAAAKVSSNAKNAAQSSVLAGLIARALISARQ